MDLQEKLTYFKASSQEAVKEDIFEQLDAYERTLNADLAQYQANTEKKYQSRLADQKKNLRQEFNKRLSGLQIRQQRDLYLSENEIKSRIFQTFAKALQDYKQETAYQEQLITMIQTILNFAQGEETDIYLDQSDANLVSKLQDAVNHPILTSDREFIGGIRGVLRQRKILIDYSFQTLLDHEAENFQIMEVNELD